MLEVTLTNEQKVKVTARPTTAAGNPASLDGNLSARLISGDGSSEPDVDPLSVWLITSDEPGDAQFVVEGDADLGEGVTTISDVVTLHVTGAQAANLGMIVSEPVPK